MFIHICIYTIYLPIQTYVYIYTYEYIYKVVHIISYMNATNVITVCNETAVSVAVR